MGQESLYPPVAEVSHGPEGIGQKAGPWIGLAKESDLLGQNCPSLRPVGAGVALGWFGSHL